MVDTKTKIFFKKSKIIKLNKIRLIKGKIKIIKTKFK